MAGQGDPRWQLALRLLHPVMVAAMWKLEPVGACRLLMYQLAASGASQSQDFAGPACASSDHLELWLLLLFTDHLIPAPACILVFKLAEMNIWIAVLT